MLLAVGYAAGRLRELRDPAHGLVPVAVGAAATAVAAIGFAVLQFLLGVDAPVSLLLVRQILLVIVLNTLLALPVYLVCRRVLAPVPARRSAPPPAPRVHDRRPEPAQPRVAVRMPPPIEDRRPPITPQLAVRVAVLGGFAFVLFAVIFFRLWFLQVLTGDDYVSQARDNRVRKIKIEAPRGNIVDRNGKTLVKTRAAPVVQILPNSVPDAELEVAEAYRKALVGGRGPAAGRGAGAARARAPAARRRAQVDAGREARSAASSRARAARAERVPVGADPGRRAASCARCTGGSAR